MGYFIRGFVLQKSLLILSIENYQNIFFANLNQGSTLIPLTDELYDRVNEFQGNAVPGYSFLTDKLIEFGSNLSIVINSVVLYIEADFFGGKGSQNAIAWNNGLKIFEELNGKDSINKAIRTMGIKNEHGKDEFETIGLNKFRRLEDWLES